MSKFHAQYQVRGPRWEALRREILARDGWRCKQCGRAAGRFEIDHVQPLKWGGDPWAEANLQTLCGGAGGCHARKTADENRKPMTPTHLGWRRLVQELQHTER